MLCHRLARVAAMCAAVVCCEPRFGAAQDAEPPEAAPSTGTALSTGNAADDPAVPERPDPATFNGAKPGVTTRDDLISAWGQPREMVEADGSIKHVFSVEPFTHIEVTYHKDKVASILVRLQERMPAEQLAKQLGLDALRPVLVPDDFGQLLGEAFPERGVLFSYSADAGGREVSIIILESIAAQSFLLRAETTWRSDYTGALRDVEFALSLAPNDARAHWLKSEILSAVGRVDEALAAIDKAVSLAGNEPEFRLTRARLCKQAGRMEEAKKELKEAKNFSANRPEIEARIHLQLGDHLATGPNRDFRKAMEEHLKAIELSQAIVDHAKVAVRRAAKETQLDATLAAAHDVAWGSWKNKSQAVADWIEKASEIADDMIAREDGGQELKLRVARQALACCVGAQGDMDPGPWIEKAAEAAQPLTASECPLAKNRFAWDLGKAWYDALQCYQMRGDAEHARESGEVAVRLLEMGWPQMQSSPGMAYLMGRLYFRVGAMFANQDKDHEQALNWYEKALPLIEQAARDANASDALRQGETLVSMGVSYWQTGHRDEAVRVTTAGAKLIERAVQEKQASAEALSLPYDNLAQMHRALGDDNSAKRYKELAGKAPAAKRK